MLDAPCAGTGVIAKDPSAKVSKEDKAVRKIVHLQKGIPLSKLNLISKIHHKNTQELFLISLRSIDFEKFQCWYKHPTQTSQLLVQVRVPQVARGHHLRVSFEISLGYG